MDRTGLADRHFQVKDLCSVDTVVFADSVEWCPIPDYSRYLACALYQLNEGGTDTIATEKTSANNSREGGIKLFKVELLDGASDSAGGTTAREVHSQTTPGVLDMKWCQHSVMERPALAAVNAEGSLDVFQLIVIDDVPQLVLGVCHDVGSDTIALSVDWSTGRTASDSPHLVVSDSTGNLSLCQLDSSCSDLRALHRWRGHDYEAWIAAFDYWQPAVVWSGGDDCRLKVWDTRTDCSKPIALSKRHTMGVCSLQSSKHREHIMASGSYDETIFLWDNRQMKAPIAEANVGGGVWRLKWHPEEGIDLLLAACMHNGFHVVDTSGLFSGSSKDIPSVLHYQGHESLAYGVDWSRHELGNTGGGDGQDSTGGLQGRSHPVASCSFYDHLMRVWVIEET